MMNLRSISRGVPAARFFSTSRVAASGKSSSTEVSDGGSKHDKVQEPQSSIKPEGNPNPRQDVDHVEEAKAKVKTQAELDADFQLRMQERSGDGGASGIEYEDGQPVSMKRSVRNNMFRYI
ncbi:hypothetical protein C7974DRAFT_403069 [Boeremia exigua]|uniref:uncharacterized protein n=1 Tax=Boeremia exigua TaxID=749465 RepID=UPI001E8D362E|nr:uncharacterized protein C7974DRAFT_403069 [Boeremia exigua]KAH6615003.1 hypothetical protein C7974DRAFT_403069 [Boeremia exigua]